LKGIKILAVLDGSRLAETVLPKAVELVRHDPGAKIVVLRAVDPATLPRDGGNKARAAAINEAAKYLGEVAARLRSEGVRRVGRSVSYAAAGPSIVELARTVKPDLILMAADRRGRLVHHPIAGFVPHRTQTPIVLVTVADSPAETSAQDMTAEEKEMIHV
jgi:nucleotide-binding universal stress UspA family protein